MLVIFAIFSFMLLMVAKKPGISINYRFFELNESKETIESLEKENASLNLNDEISLSKYVINISTIEIENLKNTYLSNYNNDLIDQYLPELIREANNYKYILKDEETYQALRKKIDDYISKIKNNDYQYFTKLEIEELNNELNNTTDEVEKNVLKEQISLKEYRIKNNVSYIGNNYLNDNITDLEDILEEYYSLKSKTNLTTDESSRLDTLSGKYLKYHYIIDNKIESSLDNDLTMAVNDCINYLLEIFIVVVILLISGSTISEEFNKGTIKYLLTNPYKRSEILTSKILAVLIVLPIIILIMYLIVFLLGGCIFSFSGFSSPVLLYNSSKGVLMKENFILYTFMKFLFKSPMYLMITLFTFMIGALSLQSGTTYGATFLIYMLGVIIIGEFDIVPNIFKPLYFYHWDFSYIIDYSSNPYFTVSPWISLLLVIVYIAIMLIVSYKRFNKIDVRNI